MYVYVYVCMQDSIGEQYHGLATVLSNNIPIPPTLKSAGTN